MAEGGAPKDKRPPEPKEPPPEDYFTDIDELDSLELLFARDLLTSVMRRRIPTWSFGGRYGFPAPVTPFSFRVRNAIHYYLNKESVNIYFLFGRGFTGIPLEYGAFICVLNHAVDSVYCNVKSPNDLLRLLALIAQYTVLAYKQAIHMAPYYTLIRIQDLLFLYMKRKRLERNDFYVSLGAHADRLIKEEPLLPHEMLS